MKTIALRFGENFSPDCGTIAAHQQMINSIGYVWFGKIGGRVSKKIISEIMLYEHPRILLIRSGKSERYWAEIEKIQYETPNKDEIPEYYRNNTEIFNTWFKVVSFSLASSNIMSTSVVISSGRPLGEVSKHSMSPYYIIEIKDN